MPQATNFSTTSRRPAANQPLRSKPKYGRKQQLVLLLIALLIIVGLLLLLLRPWRKPDLNDIKVVTAKISKHYLLPTNESPALATVTDSKKVQSQLAGKVKDNDKILIYATNQKAIVYRPSIDRIVDVETITVSQPTSSSSSNSTAIPDINPFGN